MDVTLNFWPTLTFVNVLGCWIAFAAVFLTGKKTTSAPESQREPTSIIGIVFQGLSYAVVWGLYRPPLTALMPANKTLEIPLAVLTILLAVFSVWFFHSAIRTLGKQWSLAARVLEGHKLVTEGPYSIVRHPIYTAMFGMLLATGLAISSWLGLFVGLIVFALGTAIRIRSEDKVLRHVFGAEFDAYARRVPAIMPIMF